MSKLRKLARGKPCQIRLPGCDGGGETTCLCHYRMAGYCGMGLKPDDLAFGAWACHSCHDAVDRRISNGGVDRDFIRLAHAEGVLKTLSSLIAEGVIKW